MPITGMSIPIYHSQPIKTYGRFLKLNMAIIVIVRSMINAKITAVTAGGWIG